MFVELQLQCAGEEQCSCIQLGKIKSSRLKGQGHDMHLVTIQTSGQIHAAVLTGKVTNLDILQQQENIFVLSSTLSDILFQT